MDVRLLKYFLTIVEEGTITKAAKRLNMAQPPLSTQIMNLENELGVKLFIRGKKRIQLTEAGAFMKTRAQEVVSACEALERQMKAFQDGMVGRITIGAIEAIATKYLPNVFSDFSKQYSNIKFDIWSGSTSDILEQLDKGIIDLAFIRPPFEEQKYDSYLVRKDAWGILIPENHPLASSSKESISPEDLDGEPLIIPSTANRQSEVKEWFTGAQAEPNIAYTYNNYAIAEGLVRGNLGLALVLINGDSGDIPYRKLDPELESSVYVLWTKNHYLSDSSSRFLEYIKDSYQ